MKTIEHRLKAVNFWLWVGAINHAVALSIIGLGCAYSGFNCQGEPMKSVLSTYTFTLLTPQVALEVILLLAIFLIFSSLKPLRDDWKPAGAFLGTFSLLFLFAISL